MDTNTKKHSRGCVFLRDKVFEIKPMYHVFGHVHESYGQEEVEGIKFINASNCDEDY